jgi:NADH:ubiquinone oxidoreductase subunit F (NADH-binding)
MTAHADTARLSVVGWPGLQARLLRTDPGTESLADYTAAGGYRPLGDADTLLTEVTAAGVQGRGGAAFPLGVKLATVRTSHRAGWDTVVLANGEEGEPASVKDRWLMRNRPHLVLDGLRLAAHLVGARHAHVYVSDPAAAAAVSAALTELGPDALGDVSVSLRVVDPGYVAGEETAAVRAINGGPAKPSDKPPRPFLEGIGGLPTLVSNVETLANLPYIAAHGAADYRSVGTDASPGSFLATITVAGRDPVLYELPHGIGVAELLAHHGVAGDSVRGALLGGYFAGLVNREVLDATVDHAGFAAIGSGLGCGAIALITDECPVAVAASVLEYFGRENAGQCGSCFNGTAAMAAVAVALREHTADAEDLARLRRWSQVLRGRGACGTLDAATNIAASLLNKFGADVGAHLGNSCAVCAAGAYVAERPFEVEAR